MKLTVTQAAKRWKKSKGTIYKKLDSGAMSYSIDDSNPKRKRKLIDVSELVRVFGSEEQQDGSNKGDHGSFSVDPMNSVLIERLNDAKAQIDYLQKQLEEQKNSYESRIKWLERALESKETDSNERIRVIQDSVTKLLEHKIPPVVQEPTPSTSFENHRPKETITKESKRKGILMRMVEAALD